MIGLASVMRCSLILVELTYLCALVEILLHESVEHFRGSCPKRNHPSASAEIVGSRAPFRRHRSCDEGRGRCRFRGSDGKSRASLQDGRPSSVSLSVFDTRQPPEKTVT